MGQKHDDLQIEVCFESAGVLVDELAGADVLPGLRCVNSPIVEPRWLEDRFLVL